MKIGIATCAEKPKLTEGDRILSGLLNNRGVQTVPFIWNDQSISYNDMKAVLVRSTWDYHKNASDFLYWIDSINERNILLINSSDVIKWNHNKAYLLELAQTGVAVVPSLLFSQHLELDRIVEEILKTNWKKVVVKPSVSASAYLTFLLESTSNELLNTIEKIKPHSDVLVQPFIPSITYDGEVSLIFFNNNGFTYSHSVLKCSTNNDFRIQSDFGGSVIGFESPPALIDFAVSCLSRISGNWTFARVDVVDWKENPLLSELELIEPDLFLMSSPKAAEILADAIIKKLNPLN